MTKLNLTCILILSLLFIACSKDDDFLPEVDIPWEEEVIDGSSVTIKGFESGDAVTRSSWVFDGQKLVFGWNNGDKVGLYPTAGNANPVSGESSWVETNPEYLDPSVTGNKHPAYTSENLLCKANPERSNNTLFNIPSATADSQTARIVSESSEFEWDEKIRWTAYFPYKAVDQNSVFFTNRTFSFTNQTQKGLPDISAYKKGTGSDKTTGANNTVYKQSEATACQHLGGVDFLISPEMEWTGSRINFQLRHIGAVARFYLLAPKKNLVITNLKLICNKKIFYTGGTFDLSSHVYDANAEDGNYGVKLVDAGSSATDCQISPDASTLTNMLELKFESGTAKTTYDANDSYKRYLVAYLMMYPIKYDSTTDGDLFVYVTALDESDNEVHFVSNALASKTMKSGYYYQWTSATHEDDGLYPIELTATLLPWQDIIGGGIETDLTK